MKLYKKEKNIVFGAILLLCLTFYQNLLGSYLQGFEPQNFKLHDGALYFQSWNNGNIYYTALNSDNTLNENFSPVTILEGFIPKTSSFSFDIIGNQIIYPVIRGDGYVDIHFRDILQKNDSQFLGKDNFKTFYNPGITGYVHGVVAAKNDLIYFGTTGNQLAVIDFERDEIVCHNFNSQIIKIIGLEGSNKVAVCFNDAIQTAEYNDYGMIEVYNDIFKYDKKFVEKYELRDAMFGVYNGCIGIYIALGVQWQGSGRHVIDFYRFDQNYSPSKQIDYLQHYSISSGTYNWDNPPHLYKVFTKVSGESKNLKVDIKSVNFTWDNSKINYSSFDSGYFIYQKAAEVVTDENFNPTKFIPVGIISQFPPQYSDASRPDRIYQTEASISLSQNNEKGFAASIEETFSAQGTIAGEIAGIPISFGAGYQQINSSKNTSTISVANTQTIDKKNLPNVSTNGRILGIKPQYSADEYLYCYKNNDSFFYPVKNADNIDNVMKIIKLNMDSRSILQSGYQSVDYNFETDEADRVNFNSTWDALVKGTATKRYINTTDLDKWIAAKENSPVYGWVNSENCKNYSADMKFDLTGNPLVGSNIKYIAYNFTIDTASQSDIDYGTSVCASNSTGSASNFKFKLIGDNIFDYKTSVFHSTSLINGSKISLHFKQPRYGEQKNYDINVCIFIPTQWAEAKDLPWSTEYMKDYNFPTWFIGYYVIPVYNLTNKER